MAHGQLQRHTIGVKFRPHCSSCAQVNDDDDGGGYVYFHHDDDDDDDDFGGGGGGGFGGGGGDDANNHRNTTTHTQPSGSHAVAFGDHLGPQGDECRMTCVM